jgi:hypothetical protein
LVNFEYKDSICKIKQKKWKTAYYNKKRNNWAESKSNKNKW